MQRDTTQPLYDDEGQRLYIDQSERRALIWAAVRAANPLHRTLTLTLLFTGCRISEALALRPEHIQLRQKAIVFRTLKQHSEKPRWRVVPVPGFLIRDLVRTFGIELDEGVMGKRRLWPVTANTARSWVQALMIRAAIAPGPHRTPKGLRHGYGVNAVLRYVPLTDIQENMGHTDIKTTRMYLQVVGPEKRKLAKRMWRGWDSMMPLMIITLPGILADLAISASRIFRKE